MLYVTTSWDDGDALDVRLAELLDRYGIKGTFYMTKDYRLKRLSDEEIRSIARRHEIGAHTLTHVDLSRSSAEIQKKEISGSKQWLESVLGKTVEMFCYPFGRVGEESREIVREAGFRGARTTEYGSVDFPADGFHMPTTIQVYPFPLRKKDAHSLYWRRLFQPLRQRGPVFRRMGLPLASFISWQALARAAFDKALEKGGVFHVWGHSWEIEKYGMWEEFESLLKYISGRTDCGYLTNGDIIGKI